MGKTEKLNLVKVCATFIVAFLIINILSVGVSTSALECADGIPLSDGVCGTDSADVHVSVEGGWAISVSSSGMLNLDLAPTSSGTFSTVTDDLNIYTNIPTGYQLYLNSASGSTDIYNNDVLDDNGNLLANLPAGTNTNHFVATTGTKDAPVDLTNNTWGYSLDTSPATFAKVSLTIEGTDSNIYANPTKTPSSGDNIPVTYGFKADTGLSPGTYSTSVTYTAIADVPTYTITSVSPNELKLDDQTDKTITIMTSTPTSELAFGNISAKITNGTSTVNLTDCTETAQDVSGTSYRGVECIYNGNLDYGTYNVELTSSWHNATYILTDGFNIGGKTIADITYMQEMTPDICKNSTTKQKAQLLDSRGQGNGGSDKTSTYGIVKALGDQGDGDSECWMTDNLNLYNVTISASDSDFDSPETYVVPAGITAVNQWNTQSSYTAKKLEVAHGLGRNANTKQGDGIWGTVYYNWPVAIAKETGAGYTSDSDAPDTSICPRNWMLPVNGNASAARSWAHLLQNVSSTPITTSAQLLTNADLGVTRYYGFWNYAAPSEYSQGTAGLFWSGTPSAVAKSYAIRYRDAGIDQYADNSGSGNSIRCVAR